MALDERPMINIHNRKEWRKWLQQHHQKENSVWVVSYTKKSKIPFVDWSELVDEALCFGWIDSTRKTIDENSFKQLFSKRKPNSTWSKINKEKIERLTAAGLMTDAGQEVIERAKKNGSWNLLDEVEEMLVPKDLEHAFTKNIKAKEFYESLTKSPKKMILHRIKMAKRQETRQKRIDEIIVMLSEKKKPI